MTEKPAALGDLWSAVDMTAAALLTAKEAEQEAHREWNHASTRTSNARTAFQRARENLNKALAAIEPTQ